MVAESEAGSEVGGVVEEGVAEVVMEEEDVVQLDEEEEREREEAQEVGETEAARRLGRKRPRRSLPAPSPELGAGELEESPPPKRRRRREAASPAQQQQPAKKARARPPTRPPSPPQPEPQPPRQAQAKPKGRSKKPARRSKAAADDEDAEPGSNSVPVTVQRFTKPPRASEPAEGGDDPATDILTGEIPFTSRSGVNSVDVLSKLCEELVEVYMDKLEARARAAEDAATRREQKTMYRALEAFQEELRTRLLEHVRRTVGRLLFERIRILTRFPDHCPRQPTRPAQASARGAKGEAHAEG